ncbi:MAG: hypothetical protein ACOX3T_05850 [Bdellovibrionota bacterium]
MARVVYPFELSDPDFTWLINNYLEENPNIFTVQTEGCPIILLSNCEIFDQNNFLNENLDNLESLDDIEKELIALLRKPNT